MSDWNASIIEEFRANDGKVGGPFQGATMLLLHTTGARTGAERVHPVLYQAKGEDVVVFASYAGAPTHPAWYHNLVAHPEVQVEIGGDTVAMVARVAEGAERDQLWERQKALVPSFAGYEEKTTRQIPVVVLERA